MTIKAREGDFIEDINRVIFDVKGLVHPADRIVAFPRFIPSFSGNRKRKNTLYGKVYALSERFRFIRQSFPDYLVHDSVSDERLCEVPKDNVKRRYEPVEKLQGLRNSKDLEPLEARALQFAELLKDHARTSWRTIGISGSILVGLHTESSDIDPVVYGSEACWKTHSALTNLLKQKSGPFRAYDHEGLKALFDFRSKDTAGSIKDFVRTESRKVIQGKFMGTDFFVRFVKDWSEIDEKYGDVHYRNVGYARIKATVVEDSESIFTPCKYIIEGVNVIEGNKVQPLNEIASFRGRFCEQAKEGEVVFAQGKVERVIDKKHDHEYFRLLLGNKPSDFMTLA
jgi:predicted nucleotidyltransferase